MPVEGLTPLVGKFFVEQIYTANFLQGIVVELVGSFGYEFGKARLNQLGSKLREIWRSGAGFKNHDLLKALRFAECQAMVAVCELCLVEDYESYPNPMQALVRGPDLSFITDPEVRLVATIRRDYLTLARRVADLSPQELEAQMAAQLADVKPLVRAGQEMGGRELQQELRRRVSERARDVLTASFKPDLITRMQNRIIRLFANDKDSVPETSIPAALLKRLDQHWFDFLCLAFREVLKDRQDHRFGRAREAFDLDVLSGLPDGPQSFDEIETKLAALSRQVDGLYSFLKELRRLLQQAQQEGRLEHAETQQQFSALLLQIREADRKLDVIHDTTQSTLAGVERIETGQAEIKQLIAELQPRAVSDDLTPDPLPPEPLCLKREREVAAVVATLLADPPQPFPVVGQPGIGKSTITLKAAHDQRVAAHFGDRRYFIRCDGIEDALVLETTIALYLGLPAAARNKNGIIASLSEQPALIILDNFETPWNADTVKVENLVEHLAALRHSSLVVSIRGDAVPGRVQWRSPLEPPPLDLAASRELFLAIAPQAAEPPALLDQLLGEMDGLPLAITLLAEAARTEFGLDVLSRRWQQEKTELLRRGSANDRMLSLNVSVMVSVNSPQMKGNQVALRLLSALSLLPDGLTVTDIEALFPAEGLSAAATLRNVGLAFPERGRLRVLKPIRESVPQTVERASPPPPADRARVIAHFLKLAAEDGPQAGTGAGADAIKRLAPETGNLEAIILLALDDADPRPAIEAAIAMTNFVCLSGLGSARALEEALVRAKGLSAALEAECLFNLGLIAQTRSANAEARARFEQALPLYRKVGDVLGEANCISNLGEIAQAEGDQDKAREYYRRALEMYERTRSRYSMGIAHYRLALIAEDKEEQRQHVRAARELWDNLPHLMQMLDEQFGDPAQ
jgi:tetratricopeptide (TPR) repeat protein